MSSALYDLGMPGTQQTAVLPSLSTAEAPNAGG